MVTEEKIKIFDKYKGDIDLLARVGHDFEQNIFENEDWHLISSLNQDIELINKKLVAPTFIEQTLKSIKENCDKKSFEILTNKILLYQDFLKVADILEQVKSYITIDTDTIWAGYDNSEQFLIVLNQDIFNIRNCNFLTLDKVHAHFLASCTYQDISVSNGWGDDYIKIASEFDKLYEKIKNKNST